MTIDNNISYCSSCFWCAGCCDHCSLNYSVSTPSGVIIGHAKQAYLFFISEKKTNSLLYLFFLTSGSLWEFKFNIKDDADNKICTLERLVDMFKIPFKMNFEVKFKIIS